MAVPYHTHSFEIPSATKSEVEAGVRTDVAATPASLGSAASKDVSYFATSEQGEAATTAVQSVNGKAGKTITLAKADIGLGNVENTSDADKPISSATQAALILKANAIDLGTAASRSIEDFATADQGVLADGAAQSSDLGALALKDTITTTDILAAGSADPDAVLTRGGLWIKPTGIGDMLQAVYDPDGTGKVLIAKEAEKVALGSVTGLQEVLDEKANTSDLIDFDTKEEVSQKIEAALTDKAVRVDAVQAHTPEEQGQARANIGADLLSGFRNKIINGDFTVWQRGNSFTVPAGGRSYTADRWGVVNSTNQPLLVEMVGPYFDQGSPGYFMRLSFVTAPTTGEVYVLQAIEGVATLAGKTATFTALLGSPSGTPVDFTIYTAQRFGVGGSATVPTIFANAVTVSEAFQKVSTASDLPSIVGKEIGEDSNLHVAIQFSPRHAGIAYDIAHVSLVEGDATAEADPFSLRHIQQEEALCFRYFSKTYASITFHADAPQKSSTTLVSFPVSMRQTPTAIKLGIDPANVLNIQSSHLYTVTKLNLKFEVVASNAGLTYVDAQPITLDAEFPV